MKIISPYTICFVLILYVFSSCKDPAFDDSLLNGNDAIGVNYKDDFTIICNTEKDTIYSGKNREESLLGNIQEANFGSTYASFYTNFRLLSNNVNLGTSPISIDSCFFQLEVSNYYGKFTKPLDIILYRLSESINGTDDYLTNRSFSVQLPEVGRYTLNYTKGSSLLKIPLYNSFGQDIVNQSGNSNLANNTNFQNWLQGIYVTVNNSSIGDGMLSMNLIGGNSKLIFYYKASGDTTKRFEIPINDQCARVNHYVRNKTGSTADIASNTNIATGATKTYIDGLSSYRTTIKFDKLDTLSLTAVNKAELLVFPIDADSVYSLPSRLYISRIGDDGKDVVIPDFISLSNAGGNRDTTTINGNIVNVYKLNLTRYVQGIISKEYSNNGLRLYVFPSNITSERMVIGGGNHPSLPMKLRLITTQIN
ncbi:MAG: DUF4270 family protein [Bacteroidota bacterium]